MGNGLGSFYDDNRVSVEGSVWGGNEELLGKVVKRGGERLGRGNKDSKVVVEFRIEGRCENKSVWVFECIMGIVFYD